MYLVDTQEKSNMNNLDYRTNKPLTINQIQQESKLTLIVNLDSPYSHSSKTQVCFCKYSVGVIPSILRKVVKKEDFLNPHFSLKAMMVYCL